jgi:probable HAF family extracellular repeat protein
MMMAAIGTARLWTGVAFLLSGAATLVPGSAHAQSYTITDLGTLGGDASSADGINQLGEAVGWSIDDPYAFFGFVSAPGGPPLTSLGSPPNGDYSYALDVNDLRQVVGYGEVTVGFGEEDHAILWQNGVMTDLGTLGGGASQALAINDATQIVGWSEDGDPGVHAFIRQNGVMTELPGFPASYPDTEAHDINQAGAAAGHSWDDLTGRQAVVWENGVMTRVLDRPPGASGATANAINDLGQAAGNAWTQGNATTAVLWEADGTAQTLPPTSLHVYNVATGLNNHGQAVGMSYSTNTGDPALWEDGLVFDVENITDMGPQYFGLVVHEINDAGQIAALASMSGGSHAVRLDPIPGGLGLGGPEPGIVGWENTLAVRGATVGENVVFVYGFMEGTSSVPGCPGLSVDIAGARILGSGVTDVDGHALVTGVAPEAVRGRTVLFQAVEHSTCRVSNVVEGRF